MWGYVFVFMLGVVFGIVACTFTFAAHETRLREDRMSAEWIRRHMPASDPDYGRRGD